MTGSDGIISRSGEVRSTWRIDRSRDADKLAAALADVASGVAVLYGKHGTGKTDLVSEWVMPRLERERPAYHGVCDGEIPAEVSAAAGSKGLREALEEGAVVFLDNFDRFLERSGTASGAKLEPVGATLDALTRDTKGLLVLVLDEAQLGVVFTLRSEAPDLIDAVLQIEPCSVEQELPRLAKTDGTTYAPEVLTALARDLEALPGSGRGIGPELLRVLHLQFQFRCGEFETSTVTLADYHSMGGLQGILSSWIDLRLKDLRAVQDEEREVAWAILEEIVDASASGRKRDFSGIPARFDIDEAHCDQIVRLLHGPSGLVQGLEAGSS